MKVSIVLPAKNESGAIGQTIERIKQLNITHEIIVVNDGSTDDTKSIAEHAGAKVIMCSAMGQQAMVIESIQAGAKDFIVKPFQADRVLEAVKKVVG